MASSESPAWGIFDMTENTKLNSLVLMSGQQRNDYRLISFRVTLNVNGEKINLPGLKVKDDSSAQIGNDGTITLKEGIQILELEFDTVSNVQSIQIDVMETDAKNNNVVVNEIIAKYFKRESEIVDPIIISNRNTFMKFQQFQEICPLVQLEERGQ